MALRLVVCTSSLAPFHDERDDGRLRRGPANSPASAASSRRQATFLGQGLSDTAPLLYRQAPRLRELTCVNKRPSRVSLAGKAAGPDRPGAPMVRDPSG